MDQIKFVFSKKRQIIVWKFKRFVSLLLPKSKPIPHTQHSRPAAAETSGGVLFVIMSRVVLGLRVSVVKACPVCTVLALNVVDCLLCTVLNLSSVNSGAKI